MPCSMHGKQEQYCSERSSEIQGLLHPAEANLGYFLVWFQSLQPPSTQFESSLALIPLAPRSHVSFKACTQLRTEFLYFSIRIIRHSD
jgi:hypothetical protein